jgi:hypothetical protein
MQRSLFSVCTLTLVLAGAGVAFASQPQPAPQNNPVPPTANLVPGGAAGATPSFLDRLASEIFGKSQPGKTASSDTTRTAETH